jgi:AraC family transcriptional regulator
VHPSTEKAVERVIETMLENLSEELRVEDMARTAMFSKFHFTRIFQRVTGISPGRFLSAVRLQEAKRLLLTTEWNVTDISLRVGYNSVGTFSTRFTKSVGLSPTAYRKLGGFTSLIATQHTGQFGNTVTGTACKPPRSNGTGPIFLGLFPNRIPEGRPVRCAVLEDEETFRFTGVPDGSWWLLCQSISGDPHGLLHQEIFVATVGPLTLSGGREATVDARLSPVSKLDPPVLLALLDSRKHALDRMEAAAMAA